MATDQLVVLAIEGSCQTTSEILDYTMNVTLLSIMTIKYIHFYEKTKRKPNFGLPGIEHSFIAGLVLTFGASCAYHESVF